MSNTRLKFRQFVKGKFHYWGFYDDPETESHWAGPVTTYPVIPSEQFTGLCDLNGVEIYEGDILQGDYSHRHFVRFEDGSFRLMHVNCDFQGDAGGINQKWIDEHGKRVIGNINENPELL